MGRKGGGRREKYALEKYEKLISIPDTENVTGVLRNDSGDERLLEVKQVRYLPGSGLYHLYLSAISV